VLETVAQGKNRALLSLATGAGKTFIAVNLLKRIADAGQLKKALFICDRDELRTQALVAFQGLFGTNAAAVIDGNAQKNARVIIATYQSLGISAEDSDAGFLIKNYPENYFSHIVIDECHRSAWGKWSQVLTRNDQAIQIGLTATPRSLVISENTPEANADKKITADNLKYFGEPVYEYGMLQAVEDGYLAACEILSSEVDLDDPGLTIDEVMQHNPRNAITGQPLTAEDLEDLYEKTDYESRILLPDRVVAMCADLFDHLRDTGENGNPRQKTIIFCVRDIHAELVAKELNNLYVAWCQVTGNTEERAENFAFKCTSESGGRDYIADMKGSNSDYFIATTVDLLSTGVDIPAVRNIVFFRYMKSPISFHQMVGRGTRLAENKLMFTVYDYTDATRLFGEDFLSKQKPKYRHSGSGVITDPPIVVEADGFMAQVTDTGRYVVSEVNGVPQRITIEEYKAGLAKQVVAEAPTIDEFRAKWISPEPRRSMIEYFVINGYSPELVKRVEQLDEFDMYDVLVDIAYGAQPLKRSDRVFSFTYKQKPWLEKLPNETQNVIYAIVNLFDEGGTEVFESSEIFNVQSVSKSGGLNALKKGGDAAELIHLTKERVFAA
jgi:type I restriction enzyme R subunit